MEAISANYQELLPKEIAAVAAECAAAWQDPDIPRRQYESVVMAEMAQFRSGVSVAPFAALLRCWHAIPWAAGYRPSVLDVGAATGSYSEILNSYDVRVRYTGVDFSESFAELARRLYPGINYEVADARCLPFAANAFDAVVSSACILHVLEYEEAIQEVARVAEMYVIFNKTPLAQPAPTTPTIYFRKEAYGVECLEIHFNEAEFLEICKRNGLDLMYFTKCGESAGSYVFRKQQLPEPYASDKNV